LRAGQFVKGQSVKVVTNLSAVFCLSFCIGGDVITFAIISKVISYAAKNDLHSVGRHLTQSHFAHILCHKL